MKKILNSKSFIAIAFFCLGFLVNQGLRNYHAATSIPDSRFPFNPEDFELDIKKAPFGRDFQGASTVGLLSKREDATTVYYEIPLKENLSDKHKMNVDIKDGVIKISEELKSDEHGSIETSSERIFTIDSNLDSTKAEVINEKDKIVIKIPKK